MPLCASRDTLDSCSLCLSEKSGSTWSYRMRRASVVHHTHFGPGTTSQVKLPSPGCKWCKHYSKVECLTSMAFQALVIRYDHTVHSTQIFWVSLHVQLKARFQSHTKYSFGVFAARTVFSSSEWSWSHRPNSMIAKVIQAILEAEGALFLTNY